MTTMNGSYAHPARRWLLVPILVAAGFLATGVIAWFYDGPSTGAYSPAPWPFFWFPFGFLFFIPIFFVGFFFVRWIFWGGWGWGWGWNRGYYGDPALQTLRDRFARGEITREQYEQMRRDLLS